MFDTLNDLSSLYVYEGELDEVEKMFQRALAGYEQALEPAVLATHLPALNAAYDLALLFPASVLEYRNAVTVCEDTGGK